jgi:hypothetical protein
MKRKAFSRAERETMIIQKFAEEIQHEKPNEMTAYAIARKLDIRASKHLYDILRGMEEAGKLEAFMRPNKGRWTTWYYCLPEGSYTPPKKRTASVKNKGVLVGQLELWS